MTLPPLVSFVVVTHDRPPDLVERRILNSILGQEYPRKELVLVGEACPHVEEIAARLGQPRELESINVLPLARPPDEERCTWALVARARNAGIAAATGEYICPQDDDNELVPQFTSQMLGTLKRTGAMAAWCWRRMVRPDGTPWKADRFPWIGDDEVRNRILYRIWQGAGILEPGSDVFKDRLDAKQGADRFSSVDPNEWLAHREVFRLIPYRERYTQHEIAYHVTFDDLWDIDLSRSGIPVACWEYPGLIYYLGGRTTSF